MKIGATTEEIARVRYRDRMSQDITKEQEEEAVRALKESTEVIDGVTIVRMAHSRSATITDRLFDPDKKQNILILLEDGEVNYFGNGRLCQLLQGSVIGEQPAPWDKSKTIPIYDNFGGWTGGDGLGDENGTAYWGGNPNHDEVVKFILDFYRSKDARSINVVNVNEGK